MYNLSNMNKNVAQKKLKQKHRSQVLLQPNKSFLSNFSGFSSPSSQSPHLSHTTPLHFTSFHSSIPPPSYSPQTATTSLHYSFSLLRLLLLLHPPFPSSPQPIPFFMVPSLSIFPAQPSTSPSPLPPSQPLNHFLTLYMSFIRT